MPFKKRDPVITGKMVHPWLPSEPCPCGEGRLFGHCCRRPGGEIYKSVSWPIPPPPVTCYSNVRCYMNWTRNCCNTMSREHFVSQSVLKLIGEKYVTVSGAPWQGDSKMKPVPIKDLVSKDLLCVRHNSAMSPLDTAAGRFFTAIKSIYADLGDFSTLSRKRQWWLLSGEELELWLVKVAFGVYHSGNVAIERQKLRDTQRLENVILRAFHGATIPVPLGMYIMRDRKQSEFPNNLDFASLSSDGSEEMVGLRFRFLGLSLLMLLSPTTAYDGEFLANHIHRPFYIGFRNRRRTHTIALTWPWKTPKPAAMFDGIGNIRSR
jgi:hypothetical protein